MHCDSVDTEPRPERRLAARLAQKKANLDSYRPLRPTILQRLHEDLRIRLTYSRVSPSRATRLRCARPSS